MSEERIPSEHQLASLRARLVRFQLYAEGGGLWPSAIPSRNHRRGEAVRAAAQFLYICQEAVRFDRSAREAAHARLEGGKPTFGAWSNFWLQGIRHVCVTLLEAFEDLGYDWVIDWATLRNGRANGPEGHITALLTNENWQSQFRMLVRDEDEPDTIENRLGHATGRHLDEWRLTDEWAAEFCRCLRHLEEILTHGTQDIGPGNHGADEVLDLEECGAPGRPGRPPNLSKLAIIQELVELRCRSVPWKKIPARILEKFGVEYEVSTLQDYHKEREDKDDVG